jgi:hypothetical protein
MIEFFLDADPMSRPAGLFFQWETDRNALDKGVMLSNLEIATNRRGPCS